MKGLLKRICSILLVVTLVFTTNSICVLANGLNNNESVEKNDSTEESESAEDEESVEDDDNIKSDDNVGANSVSPDKETDANSANPEEDSVDDENCSDDETSEQTGNSEDNHSGETLEPIDEIEESTEYVEEPEEGADETIQLGESEELVDETTESEKELLDELEDLGARNNNDLYGYGGGTPYMYIFYRNNDNGGAKECAKIDGSRWQWRFDDGDLQYYLNYVYFANSGNRYKFKGIHLAYRGKDYNEDSEITNDFTDEYDPDKPYRSDFTDYDALQEYLNWGGDYGDDDIVLYVCYETTSFNIAYLDENKEVQTIRFNKGERDLFENFWDEVITNSPHRVTGYKGYTGSNPINEFLAYDRTTATGENEISDLKTEYYTFDEGSSTAAKWFGIGYNFEEYFNVIYIEDERGYVDKTYKIKTFRKEDSSSYFSNSTSDVYKTGDSNIFRTTGYKKFDVGSGDNWETINTSNYDAYDKGTTVFENYQALKDGFAAWRENPTETVCYGATYEGVWRNYSKTSWSEAAETKLYATYDDATIDGYFDENSELYKIANGTRMPGPGLEFKGFRIVKWTDVGEGYVYTPETIKNFYKNNRDGWRNDTTNLHTLEELKTAFKNWVNNDNDLHNPYAVFTVYDNAEKKLIGFSYHSYPTRTYVEGNTFDPTGLVLDLNFNAGYPSETLPYAGNENQFTFTLPNGDNALNTPLARDGNGDEVVINVKYGDITNGLTLTVNPVPKVITGMSIKTAPNTSYLEGQKFDPSGLVINVRYDDGTNEDITYDNTTQGDFTFTPDVNTSLTTGNTSVTIGYGGKTASLPLTVAARSATAIDIITEPKKSYDAGDKFDPSGLIINVTYDNGTNENIEYDNNKGDFSFEIDGSPVTVNTVLNTAGNYDVKVKYKGQQDSYQMNVRAIVRLEGVNNRTTTYIEGQTFNPAGLSFKVIYTNGDEETIEYDVSPDGITFNPTLGTPLKKPTETITVYYKGKSYSFDLTVNPDPRVITGIKITKKQDKKEYEQGQSFNGTGMVIHVTYNNGDEADISYNTDFSFDPSVLNDIGDDIEVGVIYKGTPSSDKVVVKVNKKPTPNPTPRPNNYGSLDYKTPDNDGPSDPSKGPMGDLTKLDPTLAPMLEPKLELVNPTPSIPTEKLMNDPELIVDLREETGGSYGVANVRDIYSNTGYGEWLRKRKSSTWYFLTSDFSQGVNNEPLGFLVDGWYNIGWEGLEKWYYFNSEGIMQMGWLNENGKLYYLEEDTNSSWYGQCLKGVQTIAGQTYVFGDDFALIQAN